MKKRLHHFLILFFASSVIVNAQPVNDSKCNPYIIGILPFAPPCSPQNAGNHYSQFKILPLQTTIGATDEPLGGTISHCYAGIPNDVWYEFTASESHVQVVITSAASVPLKDLYMALYESLNNDCVGLTPRDCRAFSGLVDDTIDFTALAVGVKYRLQITSTNPNGNGNFNIRIRSKNICSDCIRSSVLQAYPPPVNSAYPPDTTVGFCYSVVGYNEQYGNRLHGIVPLLGSGWDSPTFNVLSLPTSADGAGQWQWFSNILINGSNESGFFYDVGGDNIPQNNLGDKTGAVPHLWTFCFSVKTQPKSFCDGGQDDLSIQFINYSDGESGSLVTTQTCANDENYIFDAHTSCCEKPVYAYSTAASCNTTPNGSVNVFGAGSTSGYVYDLYNSNGALVNSNSSFGTYSYNNLVSGNYYLNISNNSKGCKTGVGIKVEGPINYYLAQTGFGCGATCSNQAKFNLMSGAPPQSILWENGSTGPFATNLCGGWQTVTIVDNTGNCTIVDSIFITPVPGPQVAFQFNKTYYCSSDSVAVLSDFPGTGGGIFSLASTTGGINFSDVNSSNGEVNLINVTTSGMAIIKYEINIPCNATFLDTIYYSPSIGPVTLTKYHDINLCYGDPDPIFYNTQASNKITWYDEFGNFLGDQFPGTSFDPFLGSGPSTGIYFFKVTQSDTNSSACESFPKPLTIEVFDLPIVNAGNDILTCPGFGVTLQASGADNFNWQPQIFLDNASSQSPTATVDHTTVFHLKGTNISGCSSFDSITVFTDSLSNCGIAVYHGFTPNGDGHNDFWFIDGISDDSQNRVSIFNRWGEKIWEINSYDNQIRKWEGQDFKGEIVPDGTYYYLINYKGDQLKGWVELTR